MESTKNNSNLDQITEDLLQMADDVIKIHFNLGNHSHNAQPESDVVNYEHHTIDISDTGTQHEPSPPLSSENENIEQDQNHFIPEVNDDPNNDHNETNDTDAQYDDYNGEDHYNGEDPEARQARLEYEHYANRGNYQDDLDAMLLCEAITACIIENYIEYNAYICTHCGASIDVSDASAQSAVISDATIGEQVNADNPIDNVPVDNNAPVDNNNPIVNQENTVLNSLSTEERLMMDISRKILFHIQGHYQSQGGFRGLGGLYVCHVCSAEFYSEDNLNDHINTDHPNQDNNQDRNDEESTYNEESEDEAGDYPFRCPVCDRGFMNQTGMGTHFMIRHNNYRDLNVLDNILSSTRCDGFPGFELLTKIKMIRFLRGDEDLDSESCVLCCVEYTDKNRSKDDQFLISGFEIHDITRPPTKKKFKKFTDDMKAVFMLSLDVIHRYPLKIMCCGAQLCTECLRNHINSKFGNPECPFCRKSHLQRDKRFIVYDERPRSKIEQDPYAPRRLQAVVRRPRKATRKRGDIDFSETSEEFHPEGNVDVSETSSSDEHSADTSYEVSGTIFGNVSETIVDEYSDSDDDNSENRSYVNNTSDDTDNTAYSDEMIRINTMIAEYESLENGTDCQASDQVPVLPVPIDTYITNMNECKDVNVSSNLLNGSNNEKSDDIIVTDEQVEKIIEQISSEM